MSGSALETLLLIFLADSLSSPSSSRVQAFAFAFFSFSSMRAPGPPALLSFSTARSSFFFHRRNTRPGAVVMHIGTHQKNKASAFVSYKPSPRNGWGSLLASAKSCFIFILFCCQRLNPGLNRSSPTIPPWVELMWMDI
ncbi:hypothetical protein FN846DRAFT_298359 [Sphaerosporella brunnea]|uniref:Secreted protein n=1 Tax=Sphaerosporella brunnea TaxID=1250544 RepID=A0A5J5EK05_9PEZI|nr:hypothetical protein FN846DRAFT_298359 [Sphaerosporella brunnea]